MCLIMPSNTTLFVTQVSVLHLRLTLFHDGHRYIFSAKNALQKSRVHQLCAPLPPSCHSPSVCVCVCRFNYVSIVSCVVSRTNIALCTRIREVPSCARRFCKWAVCKIILISMRVKRKWLYTRSLGAHMHTFTHCRGTSECVDSEFMHSVRLEIGNWQKKASPTWHATAIVAGQPHKTWPRHGAVAVAICALD